MADTIVALATPLGRSGIGVVRMSGPDALSITAKLIGEEGFTPKARVATLRKLIDPETGDATDEAVITFFKTPRSFTGEDVVEISCHGSPVVLRQVLDHCLISGARLAGPGEFSLRALSNGRINLAEAEAIRDLINAQTQAAARQSVRQMQGEFSHQLQPLKDELLDVIVVLESALEFVEDDLPETQTASIRSCLAFLYESVQKIALTFKAGRLIRDGLRVALVGRPNVGKSSLFNALLGSDRAIVTEIAGTTRDQIHERFTIDNIPISLIDTAGLRETVDTVESIGVERSRRAMADADLVLVLLDVSESFDEEDEKIIKSVQNIRNLIVFNKIDKVIKDITSNFKLTISELRDRVLDSVDQASRPTTNQEPDSTFIVEISAKTGEGLSELQRRMVQPFAAEGDIGDGFLVSDARHHELLVRAADEIEHSIGLLVSNASEEIVLVGLHNALRYLGEITGETTTEDMLTRIFSTFCIGK